MPGFRQPTSYTAGRNITLFGTAYAKGAAIPTSVIKQLRRLSSLVSSKRIVPNADPWRRHNRLSTPTPTDFHASVRDEIP